MSRTAIIVLFLIAMTALCGFFSMVGDIGYSINGETPVTADPVNRGMIIFVMAIFATIGFIIELSKRNGWGWLFIGIAVVMLIYLKFTSMALGTFGAML